MRDRPIADRPWNGRLKLLLNNKPLRWNWQDKLLWVGEPYNEQTTTEPVFSVIQAAAGARGFEDRQVTNKGHDMVQSSRTS